MNKNKPIIEVKGLSKSYRISHQIARNEHPTLKDDLVRMARKPLQILGAAGGVDREEFWALKDINFEVEKGDVVGIMGRNGSGKSTLFKILSKITHPTAGKAILRDHTTSLLEVGTGFHPELTGRENVYFNGSILGMSTKEIEKKFDDIIDFSEVEKFLDTPIKFYSSGMKVRLAFAIAAHLNPEILIIDEVLAVGDVKFKQKSLNRMKEVAASGTTILFVSHIVGQIEKICNRGIVLDHGKLVFDGGLDDSIDKYLELNFLDSQDSSDARNEENTDRHEINTHQVIGRIEKAVVETGSGFPSLDIEVEIENVSKENHKDLWVGCIIKDLNDRNVTMINNELAGYKIDLLATQPSKRFSLKLPALNLLPGKYSMSLAIRHMDESEDQLFKHALAGRIEVPDYNLDHISFASFRRGTLPPMITDYKFEEKK